MALSGEFTYHYFIFLYLWVITNDFENEQIIHYTDPPLVLAPATGFLVNLHNTLISDMKAKTVRKCENFMQKTSESMEEHYLALQTVLLF